MSTREIKPKIERGAPDANFVSKLARVDIKFAERENELIRKDTSFREQMQKNLAEGGRTGYIQICAPFELHSIARITKPKHIVEVGVSAGVSTAYLLHALELNGEGGVLHSIDLPERETRNSPARGASWALPFGKQSGWAVPRHLKSDWDLRLGKSSDVLPDLISEIGSVGVFLYDVPYEIEEAKSDFGIVDQKVKRGSVILADNCLVPITWWAKKQRGGARIFNRKNSGLRGFSAP